MIKTILFGHSEKSYVSKRIQESYRKSRDNNGREPTINCREPAMATVITCHNWKRPEHKKKEYNRLNKKSDKSSDVENGTTK